MLRSSEIFSSFSVDDVGAARAFYGDKLGLEVKDGPMGVLEIPVGGGKHVMAYPKGDAHEPASFTILNFVVSNLEATVDELAAAGVEMEEYDDEFVKTNAKGIARDSSGGPAMAWFKDPAGNVLGVMEQN